MDQSTGSGICSEAHGACYRLRNDADQRSKGLRIRLESQESVQRLKDKFRGTWTTP
jgi:hypothetical protein